MRLLVLGATGRTGRQILEVARARGHAVTAFVRSPNKVPAGPTVVAGDPRAPAALARALAGHDAVLSALGPAPSAAIRRGTLLTDCAASTVAAMTAAGVERLAVVSAAILYPEPSGFPYDLVRWALRPLGEDLRGMEAVVAGSDLAWTVVRPPRLDARADPSHRAAVGALPERGTVLSFRGLATFLVDAVEERTYVRDVVGVAR